MFTSFSCIPKDFLDSSLCFFIVLQGAEVDLSNGFIDAQPSVEGGIFVVVTGSYTPPASSTTSPFVQTFFLTIKNKTFFVSNSVFRLLPVASSLASTSVDQAKTEAAPEVVSPAPIPAWTPAPEPEVEAKAVEVKEEVVETEVVEEEEEEEEVVEEVEDVEGEEEEEEEEEKD